MLVLSRKANESLIISNNIEVVILEIRHGVVRIGIKAPRQIPVVRSELCAAKSTVETRTINSDPVKTSSGPSQTPLTDALSDRLLHSFCERRQSGRTPDSHHAQNEHCLELSKIESGFLAEPLTAVCHEAQRVPL